MKARLLNTVALRYQSLYLDIDRAQIDRSAAPTPAVLIFCKFLNDCGYGAGEELLRALPLAGDDELDMLTGLLGDTLGLGLNWAALVKGWLTPTGELAVDHVLTWLANVFGEEGTVPARRCPADTSSPMALSRWNATRDVPFAAVRSSPTGIRSWGRAAA